MVQQPKPNWTLRIFFGRFSRVIMRCIYERYKRFHVRKMKHRENIERSQVRHTASCVCTMNPNIPAERVSGILGTATVKKNSTHLRAASTTESAQNVYISSFASPGKANWERQAACWFVLISRWRTWQFHAWFD